MHQDSNRHPALWVMYAYQAHTKIQQQYQIALAVAQGGMQALCAACISRHPCIMSDCLFLWAVTRPLRACPQPITPGYCPQPITPGYCPQPITPNFYCSLAASGAGRPPETRDLRQVRGGGPEDGGRGPWWPWRRWVWRLPGQATRGHFRRGTQTKGGSGQGSLWQMLRVYACVWLWLWLLLLAVHLPVASGESGCSSRSWQLVLLVRLESSDSPCLKAPLCNTGRVTQSQILFIPCWISQTP